MIGYFDNASTTFRKPRVIYKAIKTYKKYGITRGNRNDKCKEIVETTRTNIKKLVGVSENYNVVFSQSATYTINQILKGLDYNKIKTIYISKFEHNAVLRTTLNLVKEKGIKLVYLKYDAYKLDVDAIAKQFQREKPDVVIICHLSNVCGLIQDYKPIFKESAKYNAINILDMAQSFGLIETNLQSDNIDIAIFAGHKTLYGFTGIGGAVIRNGIEIRDIIQGGTGVDSANENMPKNMPTKLEPGTQNLLGIFSLYYSTNYILKLGYNKINEIEKRNYKKLKSILDKSKVLKQIEIENGSTIIACCPLKYQPDNYERLFNKCGIKVRVGLQCSPSAHKVLGTFPAGTIRFSIGISTKLLEFKKLDRAIFKLNKII